MKRVVVNAGWWLVTKASSADNNKGKVGYISSNYLKPYKDQDIWKSMSSDDLQKYLGFACDEKIGESLDAVDENTTQLKYVAVEDYYSEDPRQLCLEKNEMVLIVEMSEDGTVHNYTYDAILVKIYPFPFRMVARVLQ